MQASAISTNRARNRRIQVPRPSSSATTVVTTSFLTDRTIETLLRRRLSHQNNDQVAIQERL